MLFHTLRALCRNAAVDAVWVVLSPGDEWWPTYDWSSLSEKLQVVFQGGATRAETVSRGLEAMQMTVSNAMAKRIDDSNSSAWRRQSDPGGR